VYQIGLLVHVLPGPNKQREAKPNIGLGTTIKHLRRTTSGTAGNGLGATVKYLRRTTSAAAGNGLGETIKNLRRTTSAAAYNGMSVTITSLCSAASFEVNSEPPNGPRPSVRLCVGPELARCDHVLLASNIVTQNLSLGLIFMVKVVPKVQQGA
jgi:hypothetical protein